MDQLFANISPAVWAAAGAAAGKLVDWLISKSKNSVDSTAKAYEAVQASHKQLHDSMFQQMRVMQEQIDALRKALEEQELSARTAEENYLRAQKRIGELENEVSALRSNMPLH